ncbi:MAG TPA: MG2 domain-containing protein, partial [Acetobacteraceae bacterium]|nr:MG2 domain-containing protein [Acetobacteraceae bacterium]
MRHASRLFLLLAVICFGLLPGAARSDNFALPGIDRDSATYAASLTARNPAGGTPKARHQAEQQAEAAIARGDWAAAAAAWEARIAAGDAKPEQWLALAEAQRRRTPPQPAHALQSAWLAYRATPPGTAQIPALLVIADTLRDMDRLPQAISAMDAVVQRAPGNAEYGRALADLRQAAGLLVRRVQTEPETDPPRACIAFTSAPSRRADFHPQDWVRLEPPVADAAVTREDDQICVSGLPLAATTRILLRAGMPGVDGLTLRKDVAVPVAMASRRPRMMFDSRFFVLPRGQAPRVTLTTVNVGSVALKFARIGERAMGPFLHDSPLGGDDTPPYAITEEVGDVIWRGRADIPRWQPNQSTHTALPLPDAIQNAGPGLYALIASPDDGSGAGLSAVQMILRTDLAPTVWRGEDGLTVQVRGFGDARVRAGVKLSLVARNNDILGTAETGADGVARFPAPLLHGEGPMAPIAIHAATADGDFTQLDLQRAAFDLSDRGVAGKAPPGPLDAFVWLDRGIYRPGETVQVMALLRDSAGAEADLPARVRIKRPNGQVFLDTVPARGGGASVHLPVALSLTAPAGMWSVEVLADPSRPPIGRAGFRVDAFVPDRMAVDLGPAHGPIVAGTPYELPLAARFLYGAPGAGLSGKASMQLAVASDPPPALAGYRIGLVDETYAPASQDLDLPDTDAQGHAQLTIPLKRAPDSTRPLQAEISAEVNDPSGHAARANLTIPVRPAGRLIGVKPLFAENAIDADAEGAFDIAAVGPDGGRVAVSARLRIVRERPDWRLVMHGNLARYETIFHDEPLTTENVVIPASGTLHIARRFGFGRYRLEVTETGGLAATSVRFRAGWVASDSPDVPDKVDVLADRKMYAPGENARIHIAAPFAGPATVLVLTDRVHSVRTVDVPAAGTEISVPVDAAWGPGAYVAVHVFHGAADQPSGKNQPGRAIGLTWVGIDPASRRLDTTIAVADRVAPRARAEVAVHTAPGAWVSLATVDEGILRLTQFASPDPVGYFLGRRGLGIDIRDDWGRLIAPAEGDVAALRQGGDEGGAALPEIPQKTVTLFTAPVQADATGTARIALDLPDFNGQVRLMVVSWQGSRVGAAQTDVIVRDALVAEPLLPRFLAPGDQTRLTVLLQNMDLPAGEAAAEVSVDGPLALDGPARLAAPLQPGARATAYTTLRATGVGRGVIRLHVTGPSGFAITRETAILVRPARGAVTTVLSGPLDPGAEARLAPATDLFIPGTWHASATFGGAVRYSMAALSKALAD